MDGLETQTEEFLLGYLCGIKEIYGPNTPIELIVSSEMERWLNEI
jgi:hypothetical protein